MAKNCIHLLLTSCLLHSAVTSSWDGEKEEQLNDFIETMIACRDNPGMFVSLVKDGQVAFTGGYGFRDLEQELPVTPSTRFNIGSLSKAFTTTLAAETMARTPGVAWDTPLKEILGNEFELQDGFRTEEATLIDLFSHRMGMPSYWGVSTAAMNISRETLVMERFRHIPVDRSFRSRYLYSNYLYLIGAYVTEVIGQEPWEDHIYRALLEPLGMDHTRASGDLESADWYDTAYSYTFIDGELTANPELDQLPFLNEIGPAGGVFSSADDMAKWMLFQLNEGKAADGTQVVPASALADTHQPRSTIGRESPRKQRPRFPVDDMRLTYAVGWQNGMYRGTEKIYHTGSYSSYNCYLTLLPDMEAGVCACVNGPGDSRGSNAVYLANAFGLDLLLDEEPWLNQTTACTYPDPWSKSAYEDDDDDLQVPFFSIETRDTPGTQRPLSQYTGIYHHPAFGDFKVYFKEGSEQLAYEFGTILSGDLNESSNPEDFFMTLNHPLSYRAAFYPQYPDGFPVYFSSSVGDDTIDTIKVPYLEFILPPIFTKTL